MDDAALFTIGRLAKRTGPPVRTIRYWSDVGAVPPAGGTGSGHRLYDAAFVARLELVATLRELGVGLTAARRIAWREASGSGRLTLPMQGAGGGAVQCCLSRA